MLFRSVDVNPQYLELFGYTFDEALATPGLNMIAPQSRKIVSERIASGNEEVYKAIGLRKDGSTFPMEIRIRTSSIDGQPVRIVVLRDLTEQRKLIKQLAEGKQKYRELYDQTQIPLYQTRICDGKLLECNQAMAVLLGYENRDECLAEYCSALHYVDLAKRTELLKRLKKEGSVGGFEIEFTRRDGTHVWVEIEAKIYPQKGYIQGAQIDITASKVLTKIEKHILGLIMQGKCNKEIAKALDRSIRTIEEHRANIMRKLNATNLVELAQKAQFFKFKPEKNKKIILKKRRFQPPIDDSWKPRSCHNCACDAIYVV